MIILTGLIILLTITSIIVSKFKPKYLISCDDFGKVKLYSVKKLRFLWYYTILMTTSKQMAEDEYKIFMKTVDKK